MTRLRTRVSREDSMVTPRRGQQDAGIASSIGGYCKPELLVALTAVIVGLMLAVAVPALSDNLPPQGSAWGTGVRKMMTYRKNPYGKITVIRDFYKLMNDGSEKHDWWLVAVTIELIPGKAIAGWDKEYENYRLRFKSKIDQLQSSNQLVEWKPAGSTGGSSTTGWTVGAALGAGPEGPTVNANASYSASTTVPATGISTRSDTSENFVHWSVKFSEGQISSTSTFKFHATFIIRVPHSQRLDLQWTIKGMWVNYMTMWPDKLRTLENTEGDINVTGDESK